MRLRTQIALLFALFLGLPVFAWIAAREVESFLRSAEERALLAVAHSISRTLDAAQSMPMPAGPSLYVHRIRTPRSVDGFLDDWALWLDQMQTFTTDLGALQAEVLLATDERRLYGLILVDDQSRHTDAVLQDAVTLLLSDGLRYSVREEAGPGAARVEVEGVPTAVVQAAWRRVPEGYIVEFRLPLSLGLPRFGFAVTDPGDTGVAIQRIGTLSGSATDAWPLLLQSDLWADELNDAAPEGQRLWLVDSGGRVLASGGVLGSQARTESGGQEPAQRSGFRSWLYRTVRGDIPSAAVREPGVDLHLRGDELRATLAGQTMVQWRSTPAGPIVASAAVPLIHQRRVVGALILESSTPSLLLATERLLGRTVFTSLIALVFIGLALALFASVLSLRIRRLSRAVTVARDAVPESLPYTESGDEVGDLARGFSGLLTDLHQYNQYLEELAARLAHEMGTPLAVVRGSLENLATFEMDEAMRPYLNRALDGADRLRNILRAMSEARRLEHAISAAEMESVDVGALLRNAYEGYRTVDTERSWQLDLPNESIVTVCAGELLAQALDKLVDNARTFAPSDGEIRLSLEADDSAVRVGVFNEGPPLPKQMQKRIFESMISVREQPSRLHLGLGLHIVKLVAQAHGGGVEARNSRDASGVCVTLSLPRR